MPALSDRAILASRKFAHSRPAKRLDAERVDFDTSEPKRFGHMDREQVTTVRPKGGLRPSVTGEVVLDPYMSRNTIRSSESADLRGALKSVGS
jgi:hypothetical protein